LATQPLCPKTLVAFGYENIATSWETAMNAIIWLAYVVGAIYLLAKHMNPTNSTAKKVILVLLVLGGLYYVTNVALLHPPHFEDSDPIRQ
jgi:hypothetical protein